MSDSTFDTWHSVDLPVLRQAVRLIDEDLVGAGASFREIADTLGMEGDDIVRAARRLTAGGLVEANIAIEPFAGRFTTFSRAALEAVDMWPTAETVLERMIAALEEMAENSDDEDTRTRARKLLDGLTGAGKAIGISVASAAITGQIQGLS